MKSKKVFLTTHLTDDPIDPLRAAEFSPKRGRHRSFFLASPPLLLRTAQLQNGQNACNTTIMENQKDEGKKWLRKQLK